MFLAEEILLLRRDSQLVDVTFYRQGLQVFLIKVIHFRKKTKPTSTQTRNYFSQF